MRVTMILMIVRRNSKGMAGQFDFQQILKAKMSKKQLSKKIVESEIYYLECFPKFLYFYIEYFIAPYKTSIESKLQAEKTLLDSLILWERIHLHIYLRKGIYNSIGYPEVEQLDELRKLNRELLQHLLNLIKNQSILDSNNKIMLKKALEQILYFYPESKVKIIKNTNISPPWMPSY